MSYVYVCRLCLSSDMLEDLFELNDDISLHIKTSACMNIEICPNDGLPSMICKSCKNEIIKFYNFKQECLNIDSKLRTRLKPFANRNTNVNNLLCNETCKEEYDCRNVLDQIDEATVCRKLCIEEKSLMKVDSKKNKQFKFDSNTEKNDVCENRFQCEICGRLFKVKTGLDNHLVSHSGLKRYACNLCPKRFCRAENLTIHVQSHSGIKPYICEICGKASSRHRDLIRHIKIHSDNKDYACPRCNRHFKRSSDVASHMRTHTGLRPYCCKKCDKTYTSHSGLRKHYRTH